MIINNSNITLLFNPNLAWHLASYSLRSIALRFTWIAKLIEQENHIVLLPRVLEYLSLEAWTWSPQYHKVHFQRASGSTYPFYCCWDSPRDGHWHYYGATSYHLPLGFVDESCIDVHMEHLHMAVLIQSTETLANCSCMPRARKTKIPSHRYYSLHLILRAH